MKVKDWIDRYKVRLRNMMMNCFYSGEQLARKEMNASSESLATRDFSASGYSSRPGDPDPKLDNSNIEEAELSLRESGFLNYEVSFLHFVSSYCITSLRKMWYDHCYVSECVFWNQFVLVG